MTLYAEHLIKVLCDADYRNGLSAETVEWLSEELEAEWAKAEADADTHDGIKR